MDVKEIRFISAPRIAYKKNTIFPESKYFNKLHNILKIYTKQKNIENKYSESNILKFSNEEIFKKEINDVFIKTQCKLNNLQIKLSGSRHIKTDYLLPYWGI